MALDKNDWKQLDKRSKKQEKRIITQVNKLLNAQTIRLLSQNVELEQKYEDKLTQAKSEILNRIDPVLKEVTTAQEERPLIENRLEALEEIHPDGKHVSTS